MRFFIVLLASVVMPALLSPAVAQNQTGGETVVVTATRLPTPLSELGNSISVVTADDIALQQLDTVPDLLKLVPGLNVVQTGGPGGQTSVFMRGTNSNHVKVLIDGIDVSDPSSPNDAFDFGQLLTQDVAKVEVLRGPQSGLYGSDAVGGVINVITKSGQGPATFTGQIEGGSFDTFNQSAGASGSLNGFHYALNLSHFYTGAMAVTPGDLLAPGEIRNDDRYDNVTSSAKLGYDVTDNFDLGLVARYTNTLYHFTGDNFAPFPSIPDSTQSTEETVQYYARATAHLVLFDGRFEQTLGFGYASDRTDTVSPDTGPGTNAGDRLKLDWQGNIKIVDGETLVLGAEHAQDEIRFPVTAENVIDSGYAELQSTLAPDLFNSASVRLDDNSRFGTDVTFRDAASYLFEATGTRLKASVGSGFKAPTLSEMFENFPSFFFFGNPDLKPEKSIGYDAGFEQPLFDDSVRLGATYFRNDIKDLIEATFTTYENVDKAETDGVEAFASWHPFEALVLRADYTYTEANDETLMQELVRRPKHKASFNAAWYATSKLSFDATLLYVGPWLDYTRDALALTTTDPGYTTLNIAANYSVTENLAVFARIDNLFDAHYQNPVGFLQPGRGFFAGIKTKF